MSAFAAELVSRRKNSSHGSHEAQTDYIAVWLYSFQDELT